MKKLLIVDDEKGILDVTLELFKDTDIHVFVSENPIHALHLFKSEKPQVVLADLNLGAAMDGVTMCGQIKQYIPKTVIIVMSGYLTMFDVNYLRGAGIDDFMAKPLSMEDLSHIIGYSFQKRARWDLANGAKP